MVLLIRTKTDIIDFTIILAILVMMAFAFPLSFFHHVLIFLFTAFIFITRRKRVDKIIIYVIGLWFIINFANIALRGENFSLNLIIGNLLRVIITYLAIKAVGRSFWYKFEQFIFFMTKVALVIFLMLLIFRGVASSFSSIFGKLLTPEITERFPGSWHAFFYPHLEIPNDKLYRNSGFMWEPGAFAMSSAIGLLIHWIYNGIHFNRRVLIYIVAILSTFSTAGYICLLVLAVQFIFISRINQVRKTIYALLIIVGVPFFVNLDFVKPKIETYLTQHDRKESFENQVFEKSEFNRFTIFAIFFEQSLQFPIGHGSANPKIGNTEFVGVNGLGYILWQWGFLGFIFVFISIYIFFYRNQHPQLQHKVLNALFSSLIVYIVFFSNPVQSNPILFLIVFSPFIFKLPLYNIINDETT